MAKKDVTGKFIEVAATLNGVPAFLIPLLSRLGAPYIAQMVWIYIWRFIISERSEPLGPPLNFAQW